MKNFLTNVDLFKDLSKDEIALLSEIMIIEKYKKGDIIFHEKDVADCFYIVNSGMVEIGKSDDVNGQFRRLARLEEGEVFGELSMFERKDRVASARVSIIPEAQLIKFDYEKFFSFIKENPEIGNKIIIRILIKIANRLRHADEAIQTLMRSLDYSWI